MYLADVAQSVRASDCGPEGRGFNSHHSPHEKRPVILPVFFHFLDLPIMAAMVVIVVVTMVVIMVVSAVPVIRVIPVVVPVCKCVQHIFSSLS